MDTLNFRLRVRPLRAALLLVALLTAGGAQRILGVCGPFADVADDAFCPFVLEIFYLGITTGTSPTTYAPSDNVTRLQMAAFLSRSVDVVLKRGSRRAALGQFSVPRSEFAIALTTVGVSPNMVRFDGADLWVPSEDEGTVSRVRASDGRLLETWTGMVRTSSVLVAMSRVFVGRVNEPGFLYSIDPSQPAGAATLVATNLGLNPIGLAFDGSRIWTANHGTFGTDASVSIVTPGDTLPWSATTVTTGFSSLRGILYDGENVWVTNTTFPNNGHLLRLNGTGGILQDVSVGLNPVVPISDGTNIWVPNSGSNSVSVVRPSSGTILATLTGNGLFGPSTGAFDGERVLIVNLFGDSVSLWKAADLTPLGSYSLGAGSDPYGSCSDGVHFWITLFGKHKLARF